MGMASIERRMDAFSRLVGGSKAVMILVAANCAVFMLALLAEVWIRMAGGDTDSVGSLLMLPSPFAEAIRRPWTFITYMVTQFSILHLLFNMLWLICFGGLLREVVSDKAIFLLYAAGGLAGGICFEVGTALNNSGGHLVGSSAAVLGIMAAAAVRMPHRKIRLFLIGEVKLVWVAVGMILLTFIGGGGSTPSAAFWAHAGGTLTGAAAMLLAPMAAKSKRKNKDESKLRPTGHPTHRPDPAGVRLVAKVLEGRLSDHERLDNLLDKIRTSGYASLSGAEQRELDEISRRIKVKTDKH